MMRPRRIPAGALVTACALAWPAAVGMQPAVAQCECGTDLTAEEAAQARALHAAGAYTLSVEGRPTLYVPVTVHVVRTSAGTGGLSPSRVCQAVNDLDALLLETGMQFYLAGPIDYIDDNNFYYFIDTQAEIDALRTTNVVPATINCYFTANLARESGPICGLSSFTWSPVQGIVMDNDCVAVAWNHTSFPHEVGHYFDLLHPHETAYGAECVDGSNCATAGDLLCDTPADPGLGTHNVDVNCAYFGTATDPCHNDPYSPDTANLMSGSRPTCRTGCTPQQQAKAYAALLNLRPELVHTALPGSVDCNANGVRDDCDIATGTSLDVNGDGIPDECQTCRGDGNCDGVIDWRDIDFFVAAMNDNVAAWEALFAPAGPTCVFANNDVNADGTVSWRDIDPLVAVMNSTCR